MAHDAFRVCDRACLTSVRSVFLWRIPWADAHCNVPLLPLGNIIILYRRIHLSGHSNDSIPTTFRGAFPTTPLLSYICQPSVKRLSDNVRMDLCGSLAMFPHTTAYRIATLPHGIPEI